MPKDIDSYPENTNTLKQFSPCITLKSQYKGQKVEILQIESALDVHENPFYTVGVHIYKPKRTPLRVYFHLVEGNLQIYNISYGTTEDREESPKNIDMRDMYGIISEIYAQYISQVPQQDTVKKVVKKRVRNTLSGPKSGENPLSARDTQKKLREMSSGLEFDIQQSFFDRNTNTGELYFSVPLELDGKTRPIRTQKVVKVAVLENRYRFFIQTPIAGWEEIKYDQIFPETSAKRIYAATKNLLQAKWQRFFVSDAGFFQEPLGTEGTRLVSHMPPDQLAFDLVPPAPSLPIALATPPVGRDALVAESVQAIIEKVSTYENNGETQFFDEEAEIHDDKGYLVLGFKALGGCNFAIRAHFTLAEDTKRRSYKISQTEFFKVVGGKVEKVDEENFKLDRRDNRGELLPTQLSNIKNHISQMLLDRLWKREKQVA